MDTSLKMEHVGKLHLFFYFCKPIENKENEKKKHGTDAYRDLEKKKLFGILFKQSKTCFFFYMS